MYCRECNVSSKSRGGKVPLVKSVHFVLVRLDLDASKKETLKFLHLKTFLKITIQGLLRCRKLSEMGFEIGRVPK